MPKEELEEMEEEVEIEETETKDKKNDPKSIIIETVKSVIHDYKELMKNSNDEMLLKGFENELKNENECINYVMNNLVKNQTFGGRDSLMFPYIHDYYVDDLDIKQLSDNWSNQIRTSGSSNSGKQVRVQKPTEKDIMAAYDALGNDKKNEIYQEQLKKAEEEAYKKAQAEIKKREEKEKEKVKLKKEEERKAKDDALKNGASMQMSIFDL